MKSWALVILWHWELVVFHHNIYNLPVCQILFGWYPGIWTHNINVSFGTCMEFWNLFRSTVKHYLVLFELDASWNDFIVMYSAFRHKFMFMVFVTTGGGGPLMMTTESKRERSKEVEWIMVTEMVSMTNVFWLILLSCKQLQLVM